MANNIGWVLLAFLGLLTFSAICVYVIWVLSVRYVAWRIKKKAPRYADDARKAYEQIMKSMVGLGWIDKKEANYQNFNFSMSIWRAENASERLQGLQDQLIALADDLTYAGDIAKQELTDAEGELAAVEVPDMIKVEDESLQILEFKAEPELTVPNDEFTRLWRQANPDINWYDNAYAIPDTPENRQLFQPVEKPNSFVALQNHKHHYQFQNVINLESGKQYFFKCDVYGCVATFSAKPGWFWGKDDLL